jgi:FkbM family methyltransferase
MWWPDHDEDCHPVIQSQSHDIDTVLDYVQAFDVCVQAGGNVGLWPKILSEKFHAVYTFEPDSENFNCLVANVPESNVIKFNAALGEAPAFIQVGSPDAAHKNNCGAYQVLGQGIVPVMTIDSLDLNHCDLLYLDIEGYELFALEGAYETIRDYHPVISIEQKNLPLMYGLHKESATDWLIQTFDYEIAERIHRDIILI